MTPAGTTHYVYDLDGHLIAEATDTGTTVREYVWFDGMPLAVVADVDTSTPHLYYVHSDHLNRPLKMTDDSKAVVWDAVYKPFGEVVSITGAASNNLRFPGQYFLIESGLHYNWYRHYDPTLGRYTQPDPPGFVDGPSVYAYAKSSPGNYVDRDGRFVLLPILAGVAAGVAIDYAASAIRESKCGCTSSAVGGVGAGVSGGVAGLFGPFATKPFSPFGSGSATSAYSKIVNAGFRYGWYGGYVSHTARLFGRFVSPVATAAFLGLALYDLYDAINCGK